jgi:ADP-ribose pyrophosphatase YjhB (NUDIX family)
LGETLVAAALRETPEEAAVPVMLDGILRVEHSPRPDMRLVGRVMPGRRVAVGDQGCP